MSGFSPAACAGYDHRMSPLATPVAHPRPEPVRRDSPETRLLRVAAEHLARYGPRRLTVVGVAEEAGMTHANVYRYFPSKADLIDAVAGQWLKDVEASLADIADSPDPADDKLERFVVAIAKAVSRNAQSETPMSSMVYVTGVENAPRGGGPIARKQSAHARSDYWSGSSTRASRPKSSTRATGSGRSPFVIDAVQRFVNPAMVRIDVRVPRAVLDERNETSCCASCCEGSRPGWFDADQDTNDRICHLYPISRCRPKIARHRRASRRACAVTPFETGHFYASSCLAARRHRRDIANSTDKFKGFNALNAIGE